MRLRPARTYVVRVGVAGVTAVLLGIISAGHGYADTPTPTPSASPTPATSTTVAAKPSASATPTPTPPGAVTTGSATTSSATPPADPGRRLTPQAEQGSGLTLAVTSTFGAGNAFWSDIGEFAFRGSASGLADDAPIEIYRRSGSAAWARLTTTSLDSGGYAVDSPVLSHGTFTFVATSGGPPGTGDALSSNSVNVTVKDSAVRLNRPVERIDALKNPRLTGSIVPVRAGVTVNIDLLTRRGFRRIDGTRTDANGRFALYLSHGRGRLVSYRIRATYRVPNRVRWEASGSHRFWRVAVLNGVVTRTTAAEVATTYHSGCPVGPSRLRTITMNYYGLDKLMHRGVLIVRSDLTGKVKYAFGRSLRDRFPITRMNNPNVYGGNDPKQMAADNSSGFNCRRAVSYTHLTLPTTPYV